MSGVGAIGVAVSGSALFLEIVGGVSGVTASILGVSEFSEGAQDLYMQARGIEGKEAINPLKSVMGEKAYNTTLVASTFVSDIVCIADAIDCIYNFRGDGIAGYIKNRGTAKVHTMTSKEPGGVNAESGIKTDIVQYREDFGKMGIYVKNPNIKVDWSQHSEHGFLRMKQRGMTQEMVDKIVKNGKTLLQNNGSKFVFVTREGVAVVSKDGKLITAWSSDYYDQAMEKIVIKLFGAGERR